MASIMSVVINGTVGQGGPLEGNQTFSQFIGFGSGNVDTGYFFTHPVSNNPAVQNQYNASVAAGGGIPTSLGGVMATTLLAKDYGLSAIPVGEPGGTIYAASAQQLRGH